jgi:myo-inositol-1(or 4)-monophosphatase
MMGPEGFLGFMNTSASTLDLKIALETAREAAQEGSKVLRKYFGRVQKVAEKEQAGLVSEADIESEEVIRKRLQRDFPLQFLGEEMIGTGTSPQPQEGNWWIVDPLDGTTNYVHGFPIFCVSIGLMWEGQLVLGLVEVPLLDTTYWATRGGGAFKNGQPIKASSRAQISQSLLATGFFRDRPEALGEQLRIFSKLVHEARGIRRAGAAAVDLCMVAEGVFDGFWEKNLKPWDTAAGIVIVEEAGGMITDYQGNKFNFKADSILASNRHLHRDILQAIASRPVKN